MKIKKAIRLFRLFLFLMITFLFIAPSFPTFSSADTGKVQTKKKRKKKKIKKKLKKKRRHHSRKKRKKRRKKRRKRRRSKMTPAYKAMRRRWHKKAPKSIRKKWLDEDPPPLVLRPVGQDKSYKIYPDNEGHFSEDALKEARKAFAWKKTGQEHNVHPRLLELLYRAVIHFKSPYVIIVSGYRDGRKTSRHSQGKASDVVLPGVGDRQLAKFLRKQGFVGVGIYPISGFVHLDVRSKSYFWIDRSGPGQRSRGRAAYSSEIWKYDAKAEKRGEESVEDLENVSNEIED